MDDKTVKKKSLTIDDSVHYRLILYKASKRCRSLSEALDLLLKESGVA